MMLPLIKTFCTALSVQLISMFVSTVRPDLIIQHTYITSKQRGQFCSHGGVRTTSCMHEEIFKVRYGLQSEKRSSYTSINLVMTSNLRISVPKRGFYRLFYPVSRNTYALHTFLKTILKNNSTGEPPIIFFSPK